jgi:hypothetical protein
MSCILLLPSHHAALAACWRTLTPDALDLEVSGQQHDAAEVSKILALENGRAYFDRYRDKAWKSREHCAEEVGELAWSAKLTSEWEAAFLTGKVSYVQAMKWLHSYVYQASDSRTYHGSPAEEAIEKLRLALFYKLVHSSPEWATASWTCDNQPR